MREQPYTLEDSFQHQQLVLEVTDLKEKVESRDVQLAHSQVEICQLQKREIATVRAYRVQLNHVKELQRAHLALVRHLKMNHEADKKRYQAIINDLLEEILMAQLNKIKVGLKGQATDTKSKVADSNLESTAQGLTALNQKYEKLNLFVRKSDEQIQRLKEQMRMVLGQYSPLKQESKEKQGKHGQQFKPMPPRLVSSPALGYQALPGRGSPWRPWNNPPVRPCLLRAPVTFSELIKGNKNVSVWSQPVLPNSNYLTYRYRPLGVRHISPVPAQSDLNGPLRLPNPGGNHLEIKTNDGTSTDPSTGPLNRVS